MFTKTIITFILIISTALSIQIIGQNDYIGEIGISGGGAYYLGDANSIPFMNLQPAYGIFYRHRLDERFALKFDLFKSTIVGGTTSFKNNIHNLDACYEFNFFDLEQNPYKRNTRKISTYIFAGLGIVNYQYNGGQQFSTSIPFGVGIKIKLAERLNFNSHWTTRLVHTDKLEDVSSLSNPGGMNGSNFTNNDLHNTFTIGFSYDIFKNECDCKDKK